MGVRYPRRVIWPWVHLAGQLCGCNGIKPNKSTIEVTLPFMCLLSTSLLRVQLSSAGFRLICDAKAESTLHAAAAAAAVDWATAATANEAQWAKVAKWPAQTLLEPNDHQLAPPKLAAPRSDHPPPAAGHIWLPSVYDTRSTEIPPGYNLHLHSISRLLKVACNPNLLRTMSAQQLAMMAHPVWLSHSNYNDMPTWSRHSLRHKPRFGHRLARLHSSSSPSSPFSFPSAHSIPLLRPVSSLF